MRNVYLILALFLASLNLRPPITSVSPLVDTIRGELGMNGVIAGLLTSLPVLCMGIFAPSAVKLSKKWGLEGTVALALLLIGIATALRAWAASSLFLLLTSLLAGVGIAIVGPLLSGFIKRHFAHRASGMVGIYSFAMVLGAALSVGLAVPLQSSMNGSWRGPLAVWGLLAVIALPFWWGLARKGGHASPAGQLSAAAGERLPLTNARAWVLTLFFGLMAAAFYSLTAWLAPSIRSMGYSAETAGGIQTLFTLISLPSTLLIPMAVHRYHNRLLWLVGCSLLELIGIVLLNLQLSPWLAAVPLGIGAGGLFPLALMLPIDETQSAPEASAWSALTQSGGYILGALGPLLFGTIHDAAGSYVQAYYGLAVVIALQIAVEFVIGNKKRRPQPAD